MSMRTSRIGSLEPESANGLDLADGNAVQIHGRAIGERGGVGHVGVDDDVVIQRYWFGR